MVPQITASVGWRCLWICLSPCLSELSLDISHFSFLQLTEIAPCIYDVVVCPLHGDDFGTVLLRKFGNTSEILPVFGAFSAFAECSDVLPEIFDSTLCPLDGYSSIGLQVHHFGDSFGCVTPLKLRS
jgi:uncharacterized protein (DUF2225 family)